VATFFGRKRQRETTTTDAPATETRDLGWASIGTGGGVFQDLGFGQVINGDQGHGQETLLAAIVNAVAADVANVNNFEMKARQLGTGKDITDTDPYCHAFNVAANQSLHAVALRSFVSLALDFTGEVFLQEMPAPGGGVTLSPLYDRKISVVKAAPGQLNKDGSRAIIAGYIERNMQGIEIGRYNEQGYAISGTAQGRLHRIHYGFPGDPYKAQPFVANAAIPISTVHYSNLAIRSLMANSGVPGGIVNVLDEDVPDDELGLYERQLNSRLTDPTNKGKLLVFGTDTKYEPLSTTAPGQGWADLANVARQDALSTWYMPPSRLGIGGARTYENQRVELAAYFKNMILARLTLIASALSAATRQMGYELYFEPNDVPELAEDTSYKLNQAVQLWDAGLVTLDEARETVGLPPIGGEKGSTYVSDTKSPTIITPPPAEPGTTVGHSVGDLAAREADPLPLVRAAQGPHDLAVGLDGAIDDGIDHFGAFAQRYHERVYRRVAGAIKTQANAKDTDAARKTNTPHLNAADVFAIGSFNQELQQDTHDKLKDLAALALGVLAVHYRKPSLTMLPAQQEVIQRRLDVLLTTGPKGGLPWNDAIGRDLQGILDTAKLEPTSVMDTLGKVAEMLGVTINTDGQVVTGDVLGDRAIQVATNTAHSMTNDLALATYSSQGAQMKSWQSMGDEKVRDTHVEADAKYSGDPIPMEQPFEVGADLLMFPGDPSGSPEETYNCRCVVVPVDANGNADA